MRPTRIYNGFLIVAFLGLVNPGCLMEEKNVDLVITSETCADFDEDHASESYVTPQPVQFYKSLDDILADQGVTSVEVTSAMLVSGSCTVTEFEHPQHDWSISGMISVERLDIDDGPATLMQYSDISLAGATGVELPAPLDSAGVLLINRALQEYIEGGTPELLFTVINSDVEPDPSPTDRIIFSWKACLVMQIITTAEFEMIDP